MTEYAMERKEMFTKANKLQNKTIAKLDKDEIGLLGLYEFGVMTYRGELKSRVRGWKKETSEDGNIITFIGEFDKVIFIRIQNVDGDEAKQWACRAYNIERDDYYLYYNALAPLNFFR